MKKVALLGTALIAGAVAIALFYPRGDKNAPLAFVPADTPYVIANIDTLGDATYKLLLERADQALPNSIASWRLLAKQMAEEDPRAGKLLNAFIRELDGKPLATIAKNTGIRLNGHSAFYGLGLSPVARFEIDDAKAFDAFVVRMEAAYGKPLETAKLGELSYRRLLLSDAGMELVVSAVGNQAVIAVLPSDVAESTLRLALGLDRPARSLQDGGRLERLAKDKGYKKWLIGQVDMAQLLPYAASGSDPLYKSVSTAWARSHLDDQDKATATAYVLSAPCQSEIKRIASRFPAISMGYTRLDDKHQDMRIDVSLAADITKAFSGLSIDMPGLGAQGDAPLDMTIGIPLEAARTFWLAQADAVAKSPFTCEKFDGLNAGFAELGEAVGKTAISPMNEMLGIRIALDKLDLGDFSDRPDFAGRMVFGTTNPQGLLAMAQMANSRLGKLGLKPDGKPVALVAGDVPLPMPPSAQDKAWLAMGPKAIGIGIGSGQDTKLADAVTAKPGEAGQIGRFRLTGDMYIQWLQSLSKRALERTDAGLDDDSLTPEEQAKAKENVDMVKQQLNTIETKFKAIKSMDSTARMGSDGLIIDVGVELK